MNIHYRLGFLALFALLSACGTPTIAPEDFAGQLTDTFKTDIKSNGLKLFTYKAQLVADQTERAADNAKQSSPQPHQTRSKQKKRQSSSKQRPAAGADLGVWTQQIELGLKQTLKMTGYCREGFIELTRSIQYDRGVIRGECNEGASDADIEKYKS